MVEHEQDVATVDILPIESFLPTEVVLYQRGSDGEVSLLRAQQIETSVQLTPDPPVLFGDKNQKGRPPPKIQGTEHKWREQKQKVKTIIRIPWFPKGPKKPA